MSPLRQLAAIMFTDIVGYTALMQGDEQVAIDKRSRHREVFESEHDAFHGQIIQYYGDGTLSIFSSAVEAVQCAIRMQQAYRAGKMEIPVRIGLHMGDIVYNETEVYGDGVNVAARIESLGVPGAILLSGKLNEELKNHKHILTRSLGSFEFKNVAQPMEVFAVEEEHLVVPDPEALEGKGRRPIKSIAVLPFVNMSPDPDNEYFSDGMTEEIINALTKIDELRVTSRTSSFFFKGKNLSITEIGQQLNVSTILEGSIRLSGNYMRITAQLIDVAEDYHFWSETFDRSTDNIFAVQDEISLLIAEKLREHLGHFEIAPHLVSPAEVPIDAYKQYLKSRYHMLKMSLPGIEQGMSLMEEVIRKAPNYVYAYLGMHMGYTLLGTLGFMPAGEAFAKGQPFLDKAIDLDEDLPECRLQMAWISFLQDWDLDQTYRHLQKVVEERPIVDFYQTMASIIVVERKFTTAMHYIDTAFQLDPFSEINHHLKGFIWYVQEKYEAAIPWFRKGLELKPESEVSHPELGQSLILLDRKEEALAHFQHLPESADPLLVQGGTALAHAAMGNYAAAHQGIQTLEAALQTDQLERALHFLILTETQMGHLEQAMAHIETAIQYRLPMLVYLNIDPMLKPLHQDPRFKALMRPVPGEHASVEVAERKYKKSLLEPASLVTYREQLMQLMQTQRPYVDPYLTLNDLAEKMEMPANQLSQLLNEGFDQNFSEFVNSYRIELFKDKVADPAKQHLTLLALAFESGFNSKTVFNTFFKKAVGMTPKAYKQSLSHQ